MTTLKPKPTQNRGRGQRKKSVAFVSASSWLRPIGKEELDVWRMIKRNNVSNTYNQTLKYRANKSSSGGTTRRAKTANPMVNRRRKTLADTTLSESDGRCSAQSSIATDIIDLEHYFKDDFDFDAEEPAEPPQYPHLVHVPGNYAQELYRKACREYGIPRSSYFYKCLEGRDKVNLSRQRLGPMGLKACAVAMVEVLTIHTLNITDNNLGPKGAEYLAELLKENNFIKHLNVSNNAIGGDGIRILAKVITKTDSLISLNLSGNGLGDREAEAIRPIIEDTQHLKTLNLSDNEFREKGGEIIGSAMLWSDTIESLDLSWNHLRQNGAIKIAEALATNVGLLSLNLSWNGLYLSGCRAIGKALEKNTSLKKLDISSNRIDRECLEKLLSGMKKNATLTTLKMGQNPLTSEDTVLMLLFVQHNPSTGLQHIHLKDQLVDEPFMAILEEINVERKLKVTYGRLRGAEMELHDENEKLLLEADPVVVLMEFGNVIGVKLLELFKALDSDKSSTLSHKELIEGLQALNVPLSDKCIEILVKRLDKDGSGEIDFGELMKGQRQHKAAVKSIADTGNDGMNVKIDQSETMKVRQLLQIILTKKMAANSKYRRTVDDMTNTILSDGENKFRDKIRAKMREQFATEVDDTKKLETTNQVIF